MSRLAKIVAEVSEQTKIPAEEIFGRRRVPAISRARWEVWKRLAELGWSSSQIAEPWGADHSSVLYGLRKLGTKINRRKDPVRAEPGDIGEIRRAEIIRQYWAQRGVVVSARVEVAFRLHGKPVVAVRSTGIPVRAA